MLRVPLVQCVEQFLVERMNIKHVSKKIKYMRQSPEGPLKGESRPGIETDLTDLRQRL